MDENEGNALKNSLSMVAWRAGWLVNGLFESLLSESFEN